MQDFDCSIATVQRLVQRRQRAVASGLAGTAAAFLIAMLHLPHVPPFVPALLSAAAYLVFCLFDPTKTGFVHHRRIRWIGIALTLGGAAVAGLLASGMVWGLAGIALVPFGFGLAIAHRHSRGAAALSMATAREVSALRTKILALESGRLSEQVLAALPKGPDGDQRRQLHGDMLVDKLVKAG